MAPAEAELVGLIAGSGALPLALARAARRRGHEVLAIAFRGFAAPELEAAVDRLTWLHPGEVAAGVEALLEAGARRAVLAGKIPKELLYRESERAHLDPLARRELAALPDRRDDSILRRAAEGLAGLGIELLSQAALAPELVAGEGPLGRTRPDAAQRADLAFGWPLAKAVAGLDIGQTLVVKDGAVLAVEAIEGTDAAIRRAGAVAAGATAIKVAKPAQDPRFDVPAIGPGTVEALAGAGAGCLFFEAGRTLVLERERVRAAADARGIALVGCAGP